MQPVRRAVLVVEMIRDNMPPGRPLEVPRARAILPALAERLAAARVTSPQELKAGLDAWHNKQS